MVYCYVLKYLYKTGPRREPALSMHNCQFSQQGCTNKMQTYLHWSILTCFLSCINNQFALMNADGVYIIKLLSKMYIVNLLPLIFTACNCLNDKTVDQICDKNTGKCMCLDRLSGDRCQTGK